MSLLRSIGILLSLLLVSVSVSAYFAYVPETYQTNQVYAGSFYKPSGYGSISGWHYNAYYPNSGYPSYLGRYVPFGYHGGSYPVYTIPSAPVYSSYPYYGAASYPYYHGSPYGCGYTLCYR